MPFKFNSVFHPLHRNPGLAASLLDATMLGTYGKHNLECSLHRRKTIATHLVQVQNRSRRNNRRLDLWDGIA